ncbi:hypothetical protein KIN20_010918 [Parelaphostrongylus tenuis]|uniref:Uncharacterized protein n=1 Tax=Parelaphostrongylus tenuis TaxID=148309 RepID=A0AAD5QM49_PARTN|nr:hypothetical protein KIN20_010918 [Parelaphostrongylus tenuis]
MDIILKQQLKQLAKFLKNLCGGCVRGSESRARSFRNNLLHKLQVCCVLISMLTTSVKLSELDLERIVKTGFRFYNVLSSERHCPVGD